MQTSAGRRSARELPQFQRLHSDDVKCRTAAQIAAVTEKRTKDRLFYLLCAAGCIDVMGSSLLSSAYAMACANAPGSIPPEGGVHPDAFPYVPVAFSVAVNLILSTQTLGGVISSLTMGPLSDKLGRKPLILVGMVGGALGYFLMFLAGGVFHNYCAAKRTELLAPSAHHGSLLPLQLLPARGAAHISCCSQITSSVPCSSTGSSRERRASCSRTWQTLRPLQPNLAKSSRS